MISSFLCGPSNCCCAGDDHYQPDDEKSFLAPLPAKKGPLNIGRIKVKQDISGLDQTNQKFYTDAYSHRTGVS